MPHVSLCQVISSSSTTSSSSRVSRQLTYTYSASRFIKFIFVLFNSHKKKFQIKNHIPYNPRKSHTTTHTHTRSDVHPKSSSISRSENQQRTTTFLPQWSRRNTNKRETSRIFRTTIWILRTPSTTTTPIPITIYIGYSPHLPRKGSRAG